MLLHRRRADVSFSVTRWQHFFEKWRYGWHLEILSSDRKSDSVSRWTILPSRSDLKRRRLELFWRFIHIHSYWLRGRHNRRRRARSIANIAMISVPDLNNVYTYMTAMASVDSVERLTSSIHDTLSDVLDDDRPTDNTTYTAHQPTYQ